MAARARPSYSDYPEWLQTTLGTSLDRQEQLHYETASQLIQQQTLQSDFWSSLDSELQDAGSEYLMQTGTPLFAAAQAAPDLLRKSWDSFRLKTYRQNVLENSRWPRPPKGGWLTYPAWYSQVRDIARTLIVVKYLDGMEFLANRLVALADRHQLRAMSAPIARPEGYYATHVNVVGVVTIPGLGWEELELDVSLEIQVTTQLQDNIRQLLHFAYEVARQSGSKPDWQWDYASEEFHTNYLGHVLHYIEGMVMSVREFRDAERRSS